MGAKTTRRGILTNATKHKEVVPKSGIFRKPLPLLNFLLNKIITHIASISHISIGINIAMVAKNLEIVRGLEVDNLSTLGAGRKST